MEKECAEEEKEKDNAAIVYSGFQ